MSETATGGARFGAGLSTSSHTATAIAEAASAAALGLAGAEPHLAVLFVSGDHRQAFDTLGAQVRAATGARVLIGCTGESIVSGAREVEQEPALSLWLAHLPGALVIPWRLELVPTPEGPTLVGWPDDLPPRWPDEAALVALAEPFSFPADLLLERLNEDRPGTAVFGGMASGGHEPGSNWVWLGDDCFTAGAVGVWLAGAVRVRGVVSQGCQPIGRHFVVTKAERNVIHELSGRPPLAQFQALIPELSERERRLVQQGLHVGRVTNEYQGEFRRGDFLVRNVIGADPQSGAIAIGDYVRVGQTVQFHLRDAETADEDLRGMLAATQPRTTHAGGALMFTCNGRGTRLFGTPDHDALAVAQAWGGLPLAGFFAQGELGPIGGKNFVHGFTASIALFEGE